MVRSIASYQLINILNNINRKSPINWGFYYFCWVKSKTAKLLILVAFLIAFVSAFWLLYNLTLKDNDAKKMQEEMRHKRDSAHEGLPELLD